VIVAANQGALVGILVGSIVVPLVVLAIVLRVLWRSSKRHDGDGALRGPPAPPPS